MDEYTAKQQADKAYQAKTAQSPLRGDCEYALAVRPSLRERVENNKYRSLRAADQRERMQELADLLDKHPDIARILDLVSSLED